LLGRQKPARSAADCSKEELLSLSTFSQPPF